MIAAAFISDRGDLYLPGCVESYNEHIGLGVEATRVIDDGDHQLGMAGAVRAAWEWALEAGADYLFHVEEDFRFTGPVPLAEMVAILDRDRTLTQVVLKRQPWSPAEVAAGGIVELAPDGYIERSFGPGCEYLEHGRVGDCGFSLNPCLIPRRVLEFGWPDGNEAGMSEKLEAASYRFAFYGSRADPPRCEHVGAQRGQGWRL